MQVRNITTFYPEGFTSQYSFQYTAGGDLSIDNNEKYDSNRSVTLNKQELSFLYQVLSYLVNAGLIEGE